MIDPLIEQYFKETFSRKSDNLGPLDGVNCTIDDCTCRGGRDHLFLDLKINGDNIEDIKFQCGGCDQTMIVVGDILCDLVRGKHVNKIPEITENVFSDMLGGESVEGTEHFKMAMKILNKGLTQYEARQNTSEEINK